MPGATSVERALQYAYGYIEFALRDEAAGRRQTARVMWKNAESWMRSAAMRMDASG